jgi:hypothetical protein
MQTGTHCATFIAITLGGCLAGHAQEFAYEKMTGQAATYASSSSVPVMAYSGDQQASGPPRSSLRPRNQAISEATAYCVRSCDGRYFPAPSADKKRIAEGCRSLCPTSEMQVFHGASIDAAYSRQGQPYSALANAFLYRKRLVEGCTCNGKDVVGLARVKPEDDRTLRRGDMLATAEGMNVVRGVVDGEPRFAATSNPTSPR